jgi:hypothetical protein
MPVFRLLRNIGLVGLNLQHTFEKEISNFILFSPYFLSLCYNFSQVKSAREISSFSIRKDELLLVLIFMKKEVIFGGVIGP